MLEKSGSVVLTKEDLELYNQGQVSKRLADEWGLSLESLREIVTSHNYTLLNTDEQL